MSLETIFEEALKLSPREQATLIEMVGRALRDSLPDYVPSDEEREDERLWDEQFADSEHVLNRLMNEALNEYTAGHTTRMDFDDDELGIR